MGNKSTQGIVSGDGNFAGVPSEEFFKGIGPYSKLAFEEFVGKPVNHTNKRGCNLLHLYLMSSRPVDAVIVRQLIKNGVPVTQDHNKCATVFEKAVSKSLWADSNIVEDPKRGWNRKNQALTVEMVELLIKHGGDPGQTLFFNKN